MIKIKDKTNCTGCTACASSCAHSAIDMLPDEEGFLYPVVALDSCVDCGLCEKVCPILIEDSDNSDYKNCVYAAINKNDTVYMHSASGGMFILLAECIINKGGIVCGAAYDDKFIVRHDFAEDLSGCSKFQVSKYVQSNIVGIFPQVRQYLKDGKQVLFSGTPCQVAGLKRYLRRDYDNLFTCDIICHGVPSPLLFEDYKKYISGGRKIVGISMRHKVPNSMQTVYRIDFGDGSFMQDIFKVNLWRELYFDHLITRPSCHSCRFASTKREGDITIGDFWNYAKSHPDFHSDKAISIIMVHSQKGESLFAEISSKIDYRNSRIEEGLQPQLQYPCPVNERREEFWKDYNTHGFLYLTKKYEDNTIYKQMKNRLYRVLVRLGVK